MTDDAEPEPRIEPVGYFHYETFLDGDNQVYAEMDLHGMSMEEAIGRLGAVVDRYKELIAEQWDDWDEIEIEVECPHCGESVVTEHDGEDINDE